MIRTAYCTSDVTLIEMMLTCHSNTAQCLTSVAEELDELDQPSEQIVQPLIQSVEMFKKCLELQTKALDDFKQFEASASAQPSTDSASMDMDTDTEFGSVALPQPSSSPASSEQWATIKEPITAETLVDTITSLLETLTLLVSKITTTTDLHPISVLTNDLSTLFTRFSPTLPLSTHYEARTTNAQYEAAFADAEFRCGVKTFEHANQILRAIYKELPTCRPGLETPNPRRLAEEAEAWMNFQTSLRLSIPNTPEEQMRQIKVRWDALSQALACFSSAMKQKDVENLARIHMTRGDAEMQRWMIRTLADYPQSVAPDVMLKNAGVFYRGAKKVSEMSLDLEEKRLWRDAGAKAEIVMMILETGGLKGVEERLQGMVREMDDEGLIEAKTLL